VAFAEWAADRAVVAVLVREDAANAVLPNAARSVVFHRLGQRSTADPIMEPPL
jgi:hypothetical protein